MANITNYAGLKEAIASYLQNQSPSLASMFDTFILLAQKRVIKESKTLLEVSYYPFTLNAGETIYLKPAGWRNTLMFSDVGPLPIDQRNNRTLQLRSLEYCKRYAVDSPPSLLIYYAEYDYARWYFSPLPLQDVNLEARYLGEPPFLSSKIQENIITYYAPELLLYACLYEAAVFLKDDTRIEMWKNLYDQAATVFRAEDAMRDSDTTTMPRGQE